MYVLFFSLSYYDEKIDLFYRIFNVNIDQDYNITCRAFRLNRQTGKKGENDLYTAKKNSGSMALFDWVEGIIRLALEQGS